MVISDLDYFRNGLKKTIDAEQIALRKVRGQG